MLAMMLALLCLIGAGCRRDPDSGGKIRTDLPLGQLCDGDLLFRCGTSAESQAVVDIDRNQGTYSHIGIAINQGGTWKVVHAVPGESREGGELGRPI